ncbi:hypothetical protein [Mesorhizobium sp. CN2-181]|uniref:hypothetical protein n=1 Tax=Mesorhizobium yinganensis TaxID=3157707 RepID=UPI0032B87CF8
MEQKENILPSHACGLISFALKLRAFIARLRPRQAGIESMDVARRPPTAFKSDTFEVVSHPASSKLIVFFSAAGTRAGAFDFWKNGNKLDCHRLFINNGPRDEYYQAGVPGLGSSIEETAATIRKWAEFLGASEIYTCGSSMGAYGATLYGTLLGARVLAYAPSTILRLPHSRSKKLMHPATKVIHPDLSNHIARSPAPTFFFYGEMEPGDIYCASKIPDVPHVKITTLRHVEHAVAVYLLEIGIMLTHLNEFISNKPFSKLSASGCLLQHKEFPELFLRSFYEVKEENWNSAATIGRNALSVFHQSDYCQYLVGWSLVKAGKAGEALPHLSAAVALKPKHMLFRHALASCFGTLGLLTEAVDLHRQSIEIAPNVARTHFNLGIALERIGDRERSKASFLKAAELSPTEPQFARKKADLLRHQPTSS